MPTWITKTNSIYMEYYKIMEMNKLQLNNNMSESHKFNVEWKTDTKEHTVYYSII